MGWRGEKEIRREPLSNYCNQDKTGDLIIWKNPSFHQSKKKDLSVLSGLSLKSELFAQCSPIRRKLEKRQILPAKKSQYYLLLAVWGRKNNSCAGQNFLTSPLKSSLKIFKLQLYYHRAEDGLVFVRLFCLGWLTPHDSITKLDKITNGSYT